MHLSPTLKFKGNKIKHTDTVVKLLHCYLFVINDINDMINDKIFIFKNPQRSIIIKFLGRNLEKTNRTFDMNPRVN